MLQIFNRSAKKDKRILQIGFVTQDAETGTQLKEFISTRDGVDLLLIESSGVTASAFPKGVSVFVYDLDATGDASMKEFDRFMGQRPQDVPVIVLSPSVDDALVRWFLRLRVADWVKTPLSPGELIAACGRVISQASANKQEVKCLTFVGARGGVGATTMALHAALIQARSAAPAVTTCLIDLDLASGSCADYLDLQANWQIDELIADPARLDGHMLDTMTATHATGVAVLSAHRKYGEKFSFSEDIVIRTLDLATQKYQNLVVDLPRHAESWTEGVMLGSSEVFVVTDFTVPGLKSARRMVTDMTELYGGDVIPKVIVNKYGKSLFGAGLSANEAKELLRHSLAGYVGADDKLVREAIDRGIPTTQLKVRNNLITDLARIIGK
ncbi:MAG: AAA family ATPase [Aestuariivirga sp.]